MDARLATALSHVAHDILSTNSTIKSLATQLKGIETSDVILDASAKIHRLADRLQRLSTAHKQSEPPIDVSVSDLAAIASHRFGITCLCDETSASMDSALIQPRKLQQVLEFLGELLECAHSRIKNITLRAGDNFDCARGFLLVLELDSNGLPDDSIALLLCEALMESMRGKLRLAERKIELFLPENAR